MLNLSHLTVNVGDKTILQDINYNFEKGKIYAVMGPNGSGKSTLAYSIMGHPAYSLDSQTKLLLEGEDITDLDATERANKGIFLSFQTPLALSGVRVFELLHVALQGKKNPIKIREEVQKYAKELRINDELLQRSLNDNASGGEKKKMEVLQAAVLETKLLIFDEVDTGVDVDALKSISQFLDAHRKDKTYIIITHYNRILHYLKPDKVLVIAQGKLQKEGDASLAEEIEKNGYENIMKHET